MTWVVSCDALSPSSVPHARHRVEWLKWGAGEEDTTGVVGGVTTGELGLAACQWTVSPVGSTVTS